MKLTERRVVHHIRVGPSRRHGANTTWIGVQIQLDTLRPTTVPKDQLRGGVFKYGHDTVHNYVAKEESLQNSVLSEGVSYFVVHSTPSFKVFKLVRSP